MSINSNNNNKSSLWHNALGSAAAGILSRTCTHPLDTAKARLQAVGSSYRGTFDVFRQAILRQQGMRSLYRGFGAVLVGGTPGTMLYLCSYDIIKEKMSSDGGDDDNDNDESSSFLVHLGGGMLAEAIACIIYVPVDVLKERLQVSTAYRNSWHGLSEIVKQEGLAGLYKGYGATLASFGPFSAFYFLFYERSKVWAKQQQQQPVAVSSTGTEEQQQLPFSSIVMCSASSGALASWLTSPLDMAKLRLQVQRQAVAAAAPEQQTMVQILRHITQKEGLRGLFRGAGARVLHFAPATTITMSAYESFRSFFAKHV